MNKILTFLNEVAVEVHKITWPKREELIGSTIIVFVFVAFFAIILGLMDFTFSSLIQKLIAWAGGF